MNVWSLLQPPEAPQSTSTVTNQLRKSEETGARLLELRTADGTVYLCPSRWQRMRLQWTFRHFRVLSPQVLSRSDQRLIEKLAKSAVVTPALPVTSDSVFGVVEKPRSKPATASDRAEAPGFLERAEFRLRHWRVLAGLAATCIAVTLASVYGVPLFKGTVPTGDARTLSTPSREVTVESKPQDTHAATTSPVITAPATASLLQAEKPKRWIAPPPAETALAASSSGESVSAGSASSSPVPAPDATPQPAAIAAAPAERRYVSELPEGHFAHPVVSDRNLVGELRLKALIGADGSVKEVTVISGDPKLAEIGMRAVRQWHYTPYQVLGSPVDVDTQIKMSFFGPDAISITSVAEGSK